jgi:S-adenosylmethionine:tRNA ribosyltransferase-isomerase
MSAERPVQNMEEFDYELPKRAIGQYPADPRDSAKLLIDRGTVRGPEHLTVADLPEQLDPGDLVVLNETRVIPARLPLRKVSGGAVEVLLLEPVIEGWAALVRPGRRVKNGTELRSERDRHLRVIVGEKIGDGGERKVEVVHDGKSVTGPLDCDRLSLAGEPPLPPYIVSTGHSPDRYQTVYARSPGSVAAPTAGLHMTKALLRRLHERGVAVSTVDLVVGIDTFRPVTVDNPSDHVMHSESYEVPESTWEACQNARRVVAIGTTTARSLESAARGPLSGRTELFLRRGMPFEVVDLLMTNFHFPRSTLLIMIDAFVGPRWKDLYSNALREGYRFLSFGDAMLLDRAST